MPSFLAVMLALAASGLTALVLVLVGGLVGEPATSSWFGVATPFACAMIAGATAGSVLHGLKVANRGAVHAGIIGIALLVVAAAQFLPLLDLAAASRGGGAKVLLSAATWRAAFALPLSFARMDRAAPGLAAVINVVGPEQVWVFLLVELTLVIGLAWWMAGRALSAPLCMACRAWCVRQRGVVERACDAAPPDMVRQRVAARDWRFLRDLGPARGGPSLRFDLARCPRCDRSNAVSVTWERPMWRDRCLIDDLRLGADDMRTLLALVEGEPNPHPAH